jgi:hypothetical protein
MEMELRIDLVDYGDDEPTRPHSIFKTKEELLEVWCSYRAIDVDITKEECFMNNGVRELVRGKHEADEKHPCQSV